MSDRGGRGRARGRGDRGGGPGGGSRGSSPARGRGATPSVSSVGTGPSRGGRGGGPPSVSSMGTGFTGPTGGTGPRGRGSDRGGRGGRGASPAGGIVAAAAPAGTAVSIGPAVRAVGVPRPSYGTLGVPVDMIVNCFRANVPTNLIYHYDTILPEDKVLPVRATMEVIRKMQEQNPTIFTKRGSYDGRKNLYSPIKYSFGNQHEFQVNDGGRNPRRVRIQFAATINPSSTARYIAGQQSHDENILTTLNAYNVAIRMQPIQDHPFNTRSFFTRAEVRDMGRSVELWRGYFQSVRPAIGKMVINVDISSAAFYKSGPLIKVCLEYMGRSPDGDPLQFLAANRLDQRTRKDLLKFIRNLTVRTTRNGQSNNRSIKDISDKGADNLMFKLEDGSSISVAAWFRRETGRPLRFPTVVCVQLSKTAWVPMELCDVNPGQFYRKTLTPDQTKHMVEFSTLKPDARLRNIRNGLQQLSYGNSAYLQDFGINVEPNPMTVKGRILPTPTLIYGRNSSIVPRDGQWNMRDKLLYKPEKITGCGILIYDARFRPDNEKYLKDSLYAACQSVGIQGMSQDPPILRKNATGGQYWNHIKELGTLHKQLKGTMPNLIIVILPDFGNEDIYIRIKNAGDIKIGVATQCLKSQKCIRGNMQYFANVCLKINAKLGGINVVPRRDSIGIVRDVADPTIIIGADVMHPGPGTTGRPSYAAVVGSVDSEISKYIAVSRAQGSRVEMIDELADMVAHIIRKYMQYRKDVEKNANPAPRRILFYRDGISEGQFSQSKEIEVAAIFKACDRVGIPRPKLTFIVVGKRHHVRFFPPPGGSSDRSGNAPAGLVVDREITSPVEFDFYLQSHGGLLGTSRSAHYNVLVDQNGFMPDELQRLSFSLCHVYARATRSVSIVPPVYYADTVCARARHHYDPDGAFGAESDSASQLTTTAGADQVEAHRRAYQPIHPNTGQ
ncbi:hypothetical protein FRC04_011495 [Tulasnella sp. 424]|nr:hypothetical protein FRC04_011495 [Tulasnella sp. 424]